MPQSKEFKVKVGDVVRIKDVSSNKESHRGLICLVLKVEKPIMCPGSGDVCVIQTTTEQLRYHEGRLELINAIH